MNNVAGSLILSAVLFSGVSLFAHHGTSVTYQLDKTITLTAEALRYREIIEFALYRMNRIR